MRKREVQRAILNHLRQADEPALVTLFALLRDDQIAQLLFTPGDRLRLNQFGLDIMQRHFKSCSIAVPDRELALPLHLTFLDSIARMPYFVGSAHLVVFDHLLAFRLLMVEGRISTLMQIE